MTGRTTWIAAQASDGSTWPAVRPAPRAAPARQSAVPETSRNSGNATGKPATTKVPRMRPVCLPPIRQEFRGRQRSRLVLVNSQERRQQRACLDVEPQDDHGGDQRHRDGGYLMRRRRPAVPPNPALIERDQGCPPAPRTPTRCGGSSRYTAAATAGPAAANPPRPACVRRTPAATATIITAGATCAGKKSSTTAPAARLKSLPAPDTLSSAAPTAGGGKQHHELHIEPRARPQHLETGPEVVQPRPWAGVDAFLDYRTHCTTLNNCRGG